MVTFTGRHYRGRGDELTVAVHARRVVRLEVSEEGDINCLKYPHQTFGFVLLRDILHISGLSI